MPCLIFSVVTSHPPSSPSLMNSSGSLFALAPSRPRERVRRRQKTERSLNFEDQRIQGKGEDLSLDHPRTTTPAPRPFVRTQTQPLCTLVVSVRMLTTVPRPPCLYRRFVPTARLAVHSISTTLRSAPTHTDRSPNPSPSPFTLHPFSSWLPSRRRCCPATSVTCTFRDCTFSLEPFLHLCQPAQHLLSSIHRFRSSRACWILAGFHPGIFLCWIRWNDRLTVVPRSDLSLVPLTTPDDTQHARAGGWP